jgi:hypothetical protein
VYYNGVKKSGTVYVMPVSGQKFFELVLMGSPLPGATDIITLSYDADAASGGIKSVNGKKLPSVTDLPLTTNPPPSLRLESAVVENADPTKVILTFNMAVHAGALGNGKVLGDDVLGVTVNYGDPNEAFLAASNAQFNGVTVTVTLEGPVSAGDDLILWYEPSENYFLDANNNPLGDIGANFGITNNVQ